MNNVSDARALRWKCRRGMLELDYLLSNFFNLCYEQLLPDEKTLFSSLLDCSDVELYQWIIKQQIPSEVKKFECLIQRIYNQSNS